jgi:hypothetical protein
MAGGVLNKAKKQKTDEFYTQLSDIVKELKHYKEHFRGKTIFCNCDDPYESFFFKYFAMNFAFLELKRLIATCYTGSPIANKELSLFDYETPENKTTKAPHKIIINEAVDENNDGAFNLQDIVISLTKNKNNTLTRLQGDGDFRSAECIEILKEADIIVTNPPFSLFREFVAQLFDYKKSFLIIGGQNAVAYKEIFKLIMDNKIWSGIDNGGTKWFKVPDYYDIQTQSRIKIENGVKYFSIGTIMWFTNLDNEKRHENIVLYKKYTPEDYQKYDNYNAIEIATYKDIPIDYEGIMGVPITFFDKYNPEQFEIIGQTGVIEPAGLCSEYKGGRPYINGKRMYARILIRSKHNEKEE